MKKPFTIALLIITVALFIAGAYAQKRNGGEASKQVQDIITVDLEGGDTQPRVNGLIGYVKKHMGSSIKFELIGSYNLAVEKYEAYKEAIASAQLANAKVYEAARKACSSKSDSITQAKCYQNYLNANIKNISIPDPVAEPKMADYHYELIAPVFTADIAGALYIDGIITLLLGISALIVWRKPREKS